MKIEYSDRSSIEIKKSHTPNKVFIIIQAIDPDNDYKKIINAVELDRDELDKLLKDL